MPDRIETLAEGVTLYLGDCREILPALAASSIDSCVTDPPYHLNFMGKEWDGGDVAFRAETWRAVYRVLKPGGHLLAFGGTRTHHRMACAIEDAGFEIRDCVMWLYGSGFPKSHDVSKGIDRAAGAERIVTRNGTVQRNGYGDDWDTNSSGDRPRKDLPATDAAREWEGWGTALKPACEPIVLARKPLGEDTVAANVLRWGTGAINIDGCRIATDALIDDSRLGGKGDWSGAKLGYHGSKSEIRHPSSSLGRWPANVVHDGSEEVVAAFPESGGSRIEKPCDRTFKAFADGGLGGSRGPRGFDDERSAARFFYTAKADDHDRIGSKHPTVKPLDLMQYLVRLVTRKGGTVLDPFAGTGTTGEAAFREGMRAVLIEAEPQYQDDIRRRMKLAMAGPDERSRESIKAKNLPRNDGPLFCL